MTRDFSNRYVLISAPTNLKALSNCIFINFPNLLELSLRKVQAFPKASRIGLAVITFFAINVFLLLNWAIYFMISLVP